MNALGKFGTLLLALAVSGCAMKTSGGVTERALCEAWQSTLFLPSRSDTHETAIMLNDQYRVHSAACGD